jgi:Family of unknown function (DUF5946)
MDNHQNGIQKENTCPECGALLGEGETCQSIFESFLALEYSDPGYGKVHFLTVACFMIQHGRYSDDALVWIAEKLLLNLEEGVPAEKIRRRAAKETEQSGRSWKVNRSPDAPPLPKIVWSMTIADVAARYRDTESYCELMIDWACSTLREMKPFLVRNK